MKEDLQTIPVLHCSTVRRLHTILCIFFLTICNAAYSQPVMLSHIPDGSKNFVTVNDRLYFSASDSLFTATSASSPVFVYKTGEPILAIYNITVGADFFFVTQSAAGQTLWRSDGTSANTAQLMTHTQITPLLAYQAQLFLRVNSMATGVELWKMDAAYNTAPVKDINPGTASGFMGSLIVRNDLLYFFANAGNGRDLWRSDGTTAGTVLAVDLDDGTDLYNLSDWYGLTSVNDVMFFTRNYESPNDPYYSQVGELWKTDGTLAGTSMVFQSSASYYNYLTHFLSFNGKLYFFHNVGDPAYHYISVSDGTMGGTQHLHLASIDGVPRKLIDAGAYFLFYAESQGFTTPLEKSDGNTITNVHGFSMYHSAQDHIISLAYVDGHAFFVDDPGEYYGGGGQLWQANLATGSTQPVQDLYGFSLHGSRNIVAADRGVFFTRTTGGEMTLWYYDPNTPPSTSCTGAGSIEREKWTDITGYSISSIPANTQDPSSITTLSSFATPRNEGDNYGARVRGYICVPENGNYVFYISSDDNSELWLSIDDSPSNKRLIASSKWTRYDEWTKYPTQQSAEIALVKGKKYYIEALHKEAAGADHLSVGWKLPNGTLERPIPGIRLIPFKRGDAPRVHLTQPNGRNFTAPATIDIAASASDDDGTITKVEFYASGTKLAEDITSPYSYKWQNVPEGNYTIEARATDNDGNTRSHSIAITVSPPSCTGTGHITQEIWINATGADVRTFDFTTHPNGGSRSFNSFETTQYYDNYYASRMRGWICVPQSGNYTFWISSDDSSELYLSIDDTEANKTLIAWAYGHTRFGVYDKYASQKSIQISLQAGQRYYIEARHKEANGNDFVSVGWQLPDGTMERPIAGSRLIPMIPPPNNPPSITITSPQPDQNFVSPASVRIVANVTDPDGVRDVRFVVSHGTSSTELATFTSPPYEYTWNNPPSGSYQLLVSATDTRNSGTSKSLFFSVDKTTCEGTGALVREIWTGIGGTSVSSIPVNSPPDATVELTSFATPNYYGNDYGSRIRGYVCAPVSGVYIFMISSDDNGELWFSNNEDPAGKQRIAYVEGHTAVNQWNKYGTQISGGINLVQGQRYYIEVLHKEANGADHVEVGWQLPSGALEQPIPGNRIIPFEDESTSAAAFFTDSEFSSEEQGDAVSIYPNPVVSGERLSISLPGGSAGEVHVDIVSVTGVSIQNEKLTSTGEGVVIDLKSSIAPGMYLIKIAGDKKRWRNKLQIK